MVGPTSGKTYMSKVPSNPTPRAEGACVDAEYQYVGNSDNYSLIGCSANGVGTSPAGAINYQKGGIVSPLGPTNGLIGWWDFEDGTDLTVKDKSGQGNDGVFNSNSTSTIGRWVAGKVGAYAGQFTCMNTSGCYGATYGDYVTTNSFSINSPSKVFTLSAWVYFKTGGFSVQTIINAREGGDRVWLMRNSLALTYQAPEGNYYFANYFTNDTWIHLVVVIDHGNSTMTAYKNGDAFLTPVTISSTTVISFADVYPKSIGGYSATDNTKLNGYLDDVRLYNRALSAEEVRVIYDATK